MKAVTCNFEEHGDCVRRIFNEAIEQTTVLYEYEPRSHEWVKAWFEEKESEGLPVIGYENTSGELAGFASYGPFRNYAAFSDTVEHSLYVDSRFRGAGLGKSLLADIERIIHQCDYHSMMAAIDSSNSASIRLHEKAGFEYRGTFYEVAQKFGRRLDLVFYQKIFPET